MPSQPTPSTSSSFRRRSFHSSPLNKLRHFLTKKIFFITLLSFAAILWILPFSMGGGDYWSLPLVGIFLTLFFFGYLLMVFLTSRHQFIWHKSFLLWLFPIIFLIFQLVPFLSQLPFASETTTAWTKSLFYQYPQPAFTLSLAPYETWQFLFYFILLALFYLASRQFGKNQRTILILTLLIIIATFIQAFIGLFPIFTDFHFTYWDLSPNRVVSGTFLNRNHFACFLIPGIFLCLSLILGINLNKHHLHTSSLNLKENLSSLSLTHHLRHKTRYCWLIFCSISLFLLIAAQIFSVSRAATFATASGCSVLLCYGGYKLYKKNKGKELSIRYRLLPYWLFITPAILLALSSGLVQLFHRFQQIHLQNSFSFESRLLIWQDALKMLKPFFWYGCGAGAFDKVSPRYESGFFPDTLTQYAHNDWLELAISIGIPATLILIFIVVLCLSYLVYKLKTQKDPILFWLGIGSFTGIIAIAFHEFFDYSLQSPANGFLTVGLLALLANCALLSPTSSMTSSRINHFSFVNLSLSKIVYSGLGILICGFLFVFWGKLLQKEFQASYFTYLMSEKNQNQRFEKQLTKQELNRICSQARHLIQLTPHRDAIRKILSKYLQLKALKTWQESSIKNSTILEQVYEDFNEALFHAGHICLTSPTDGYAWLRYAKIYEDYRLFNHFLHPSNLTMYLSNAHYYCPNISLVTQQCADGLWQLSQDKIQVKKKNNYYYQALFLYRQAVRQGANLYEILQKIHNSHENQLEPLRFIVPQQFQQQEIFLNFLINYQFYHEALTKIPQLLQKNKERPEFMVDEMLDLPLIDQYQIDRRNKNSLDLTLRFQEICLLSLNNQWKKYQDKKQTLQALLLEKAHQKDIKRQEISLLGGKNLEELNQLITRYPTYLPSYYDKAKYLFEIGQNVEGLNILFFLCTQEIPIDQVILTQNLHLLNTYSFLSEEPEIQHLQLFLKAAFLLQLIEQNQSKSLLPQVIDQLLGLQKAEATSPAPWQQRHLIAYFLGRAYECANDLDSAAQAYIDGLKISPNNLFIASRYQRLKKNHPQSTWPDLSPDILSYLQASHPLNYPITPTITLLSLNCPIQKIDQDSLLPITYYFLCTGDISQTYRFSIEFLLSDNKKIIEPLFKGHLNDTVLSWKIGEIISLHQTHFPKKLALQHYFRLTPGRFFGKVRCSPSDYVDFPQVPFFIGTIQK